LKCIEKWYAGTSPKGEIELEIEVSVNELYKEVGSLIREGHFKKSLEQIFEFVRYANKYFDEQKPWIQVKENITACNDTIVSCVYIIANLTQLLNPFLPFSSEKVKKMLGLQELRWEAVENLSVNLHEIKPLFERIDVKRIEVELERLKKEAL
jgi:methionyl-tRNA synthetase